MEIINFTLLLVILVVVITNNSIIKDKIKKLTDEVIKLKGSPNDAYAENDFKPGDVSTYSETATNKKVIADEQIKNKEIMPRPELKPEIGNEEIAQQPLPHTEPVYNAPVNKKPSRVRGDLENFIGENLMSKIGIIILVLGIGYFVKFAIDKNWINEYGRVGIGIITGGILIAVAHWLRKTYKTFSSILTGGGIAVLYITITIAFQIYHMFGYKNPTITFIILVFITIFSVLLSLIYDKKELAIFSQLGGYVSPFLVSTGQGNYVVLFAYVLILNVGLLVMAYFKRWYILNLLAFIFTQLIYWAWLGDILMSGDPLPYRNALLFSGLFFIVFFLVNILNNIKERKAFNATEIIMILSNNVLFFLSGIAILHKYNNGAYNGLFTVSLGIYNFVWVVYLFRNQKIDPVLLYLLIGLVLSFVSLAIPVQLKGHSITLFWSAELVILLWQAKVSGIKLLRTWHFLILLLVLVSLSMDWFNNYINYSMQLPVILNRAFITGITVMAGLVLSLYFIGNEKESFIGNLISSVTYKKVLRNILLVTSYLVFFFELQYQMNRFYDVYSFIQTVYAAYNYSFLLVLLLIAGRTATLDIKRLVYLAAFIALFIFIIYYVPYIKTARNIYLYSNTLSKGNYLFHYLVYPAIISIIFLLQGNRQIIAGNKQVPARILLWGIAFISVYILSSELDHIVLVWSSQGIESAYNVINQVHKVGYPVLWAACAFMLMYFGMKQKNKDYRILSISLLGLIILKLFIFDVWKMSQGGIIVSFLFLGVIFLIISFLYQKLKRFVLDDSKEIKQE